MSDSIGQGKGCIFGKSQGKLWVFMKNLGNTCAFWLKASRIFVKKSV